jgi:hypothetical protein
MVTKYEQLVVLGAAIRTKLEWMDSVRSSIGTVPDVSAQLALMLGYITTDEDFEKAETMGREIEINLSQYLNKVQGIRGHIEILTAQMAVLRQSYTDLYNMFFGKAVPDASR